MFQMRMKNITCSEMLVRDHFSKPLGTSVDGQDPRSDCIENNEVIKL